MTMNKTANPNPALRAKLDDLYRSEKLLTEALTRMSVATKSPQLAGLFNDHREETRQHERRLSDILDSYDSDALASPTDDPASVSRFIRDTELMSAYPVPNDERDEALIALARDIESHEIAAYTHTINMAMEEGKADVVEQLNRTLDEERMTLEKLNAARSSDVPQKGRAEVY